MQMHERKRAILNPPPHLSASSIGTFNQCPLKFKFNKIDGITDDPTEATLMGNFVHDVLETFYSYKQEDRNVSLARELAKNIWDTQWMEKVVPWVKGDDARRMFRWNSWWCIENLWQIENPETITPSGLEHEVNGPVGGVTVKGFIDRFSKNEDGKLTISDYKTGKVPKPQYSGDKFFQLHLYAYLLRETGIGDTSDVELLYLKEGKRLSGKVTEHELKLAENLVVNTKEKIDKACELEHFETQKSVLCGWCSYKKICPAWGAK
jgi:putative RecB family exonuclease